MAQVHKLDCESAVNDCHFVVQSEDEDEALELARNHMKTVHGSEYSDDELRSEYLQTA
ncbi:Protein of unknown function (DUF1059) [Halovivax ruber XH-70]|uniref:Small metal-binding protein n=1 Tax=Halovivax ruber (strain DSM 18193 / JCM 13892 / XH-70) TaxID=797302 RepID=L0I9Y3_HALRX|nr:DUF1059 domain-containing protein [Halovivax ruber]AGB15534.1 Protein of unknown function (DUF1059) [Halovivax ruber XH-70]